MKKVICLLLTLLISTPVWATPFSWGSNYQGGEPDGGGTPGGSDTQVQFNDSSAFGGDAGLTYDKTTDTLTVGVGSGILVTHSLKSDASAGILLEANNGTDIGLLGVGNTANATWYGVHNFEASLEAKNGATSSGFVNFYEDSDDGSNYLKVKAGAMAGDYTLTLPNADAAGVMSSNGSGALSLGTATTSIGGTGSPAGFALYSPLYAGTTTTGAFQSGTLGSEGHVLTSNGPTSLPTFKALSSSGIGGSTGATDNAIIRADGTGGSTAQNSLLTIADTTGSITTNNSGQDWALTVSDDQATASISWSESTNQWIFAAPPVQDSGGGYSTGNYVFQASSLSSQTSSRMFLRDNTAGRGLQLIGNNADASIGIMHPSGGGALYFPGAASAIYPATAATSAISDPSANNGSVDFGGSSNRWNNVYSEAGDFSGQVKIADTTTGSNAGTDICIDANNELCRCGSCA